MTSLRDRARGYKLTLTEYTLPAPGCVDMGDPLVGFRLVFAGLDGQPRTIHEDKGTLPSSRHCPTGYGISSVVLDPDRRMMVVMIDVFPIGFEGPDRRFMAVPWPFETTRRQAD